MKRLVGAWAWNDGVWLIESLVIADPLIVHGLGEAFSASSKTVGHLAFHVVGERGRRVVWPEHSRDVVAVGRRVLVPL